jgi:hypothetical protein
MYGQVPCQTSVMVASSHHGGPSCLTGQSKRIVADTVVLATLLVHRYCHDNSRYTYLCHDRRTIGTSDAVLQDGLTLRIKQNAPRRDRD